MRFYRYIGPKQIADRVASAPKGTTIRAHSDFRRWINDSGRELNHDDSVIVTFVISATGELLIADRRSEHVACASGQPILSAGEMTFEVSESGITVTDVSNQSTGYCPEPESWPAVAAALAAAGIEGPDDFTFKCTFRMCPKCGNRNLVKEGVFECGVCEADLPLAYNCQ